MNAISTICVPVNSADIWSNCQDISARFIRVSSPRLGLSQASAADQEEHIMHRNDEAAERLDLGSVVTETKGNGQLSADQNGQPQIPVGLSDD
jgi:hypothetical protein